MPWYNVLVTRDATESTTITLEAESAEAANEQALQKANDSLVDDWSLDDGNWHKPYLPDPDSTEETEPPAPPSVEKHNLTLDLVEVTELATGKKTYFGVNDRHYDAMLAGEIEGYSWRPLGEVTVEEHILQEERLAWRPT